MKILKRAGFNPFRWKHLTCPYCGGSEYTSLDYAAVYCDRCHVRFRVEQATEEPGCVVRAIAEGEQLVAPAHVCWSCWGSPMWPRDLTVGLFPWQDLTCPIEPCHGPMEACNGRVSPWWRPEIIGYSITLNIGGACSGWVPQVGLKRMPARHERRGPTQRQWTDYQRAKGLC